MDLRRLPLPWGPLTSRPSVAASPPSLATSARSPSPDASGATFDAAASDSARATQSTTLAAFAAVSVFVLHTRSYEMGLRVLRLSMVSIWAQLRQAGGRLRMDMRRLPLPWRPGVATSSCPLAAAAAASVFVLH